MFLFEIIVLLFIGLPYLPYGNAYVIPPVEIWQKCKLANSNGSNVFVEFAFEDNCQKFLICYKNVFASLAVSNSKLTRRFWMPNEKKKPMECRLTYENYENLNGWNSVNYEKFKENSIEMGGFMEDQHMASIFKADFLAGVKRGNFSSDLDIPLDECRMKCLAPKNPTTKFPLNSIKEPSSKRITHLSTTCTEITIPLEASFKLNISFDPSTVCKDPTNVDDFLEWYENATIMSEKLSHACDRVPKSCEKNNIFELYMCYKSANFSANTIEKPKNNKILNGCEKHGKNYTASNGTWQGVLVGVCIHRGDTNNELIMNFYVQTSFSGISHNLTRQIPLDFTSDKAFLKNMKKRELLLLEFGPEFSRIFELPEEKLLLNESTKDSHGIGRVFAQIAEISVNGSWAKQLYFVPPEDGSILDEPMAVYFQMENPKFSRFLTSQTIREWENDPDKLFPTRCDIIDNCDEVRQTLKEINTILSTCNPDDPSGQNLTDSSEFDIPPWIPGNPEELDDDETESDDPIEAGDILYTLGQAEEMLENVKKRCNLTEKHDDPLLNDRPKRQINPEHHLVPRQVHPNLTLRWATFPIQVKIDENLPNDGEPWKIVVAQAIEEIMDKTCLNFTWDIASDEQGGLMITTDPNMTGCGSSHVGYQTHWQIIFLKNKPTCLKPAIAAHEILHAMGLWHEHARDDARDHIKINWNDIEEETRHNYLPHDKTENYGTPYDFGSVMHYYGGGDKYKYKMITLPRFYQRTIGQRWSISYKDAKIINAAYCDYCPVSNKMDCLNGGYPHPRDCNKCVCPEGLGGDNTCKQIDDDVLCTDKNPFANSIKFVSWRTEKLEPDLVYSHQPIPMGSVSIPAVSRCYWRLHGSTKKDKLRIQVQKLDSRFKCGWICENYLEIKYRTDKSAAGARICCPEDLLVYNKTYNWIEAEEPGEDILLILHSKFVWGSKENGPPSFALIFETDGTKIISVKDCPSSGTLWKSDRNPDRVVYCGDKPCVDQGEKYDQGEAKWKCDVLWINGQYKEVRKHNESHIFVFNCFKKTDGSPSYWGYLKDKTADPIHIDEFQCLTYAEAGIKKEEIN